MLNEKYAVLLSKDIKIIKNFQGKRSLISFEEVERKSRAASFFMNPSVKEEITEGEVPASCWFSDAKENEMVFEQSIYNPEMGRALPLLTINK